MTKEKTKFIFVRHGEPDYPSTLAGRKCHLPRILRDLRRQEENR